MASEGKSLLRVTESIEQVRWRLGYGMEISKEGGLNEKILQTYVEDSYLAGLILLNSSGDITAHYDSTGLGSENILKMVENNSIHSAVLVYDLQADGIIAISVGNKIVISNDKILEETNVEDTYIMKNIMERGTGTKLIHAKDTSRVFGNNFGLMDKSRDYYIYAYMNEKMYSRQHLLIYLRQIFLNVYGIV